MFFRQPKPTIPAAADTDVLRALTFKQVLAHAGLEHAARHLAIKAEPSATHVGLTPAEGETVDLVERRIAARGSTLDAQIAALEQELQLQGPNPDHEPAILHQRIIDAVTQHVAGRAPMIQQTLAAERVNRAMLASWKDEHDIARPAHYPRSRIVHFRWLLALVGVEAVLQASLLLPATPDGLLGAIGLGIAIAALTTALGLAIGFGALRYLAAPSATKKTMGAAALPVLIALLAFISLYVAHYRHLAGAGSDAPSDAQVIEHLFAQPLDLSSQGVLLLLLSLGCSAYAAWKGYTASDPIPGYEAVDRAYVDARDDVEYLRKDMRGGIGAIRDATVKPMLAQPKLAKAKADHFKALATQLQYRRDRIAALDAQEAALAVRAITQFRRVNLATRADGVTPACFAETPVIACLTPQVPVDLDARIETAALRGAADAARAAEIALGIAKMLDRTTDRTDDIMASVERSDTTQDGNPTIALRSALETTLNAAASLPSPVGQTALPDGTSKNQLT